LRRMKILNLKTLAILIYEFLVIVPLDLVDVRPGVGKMRAVMKYNKLAL
jgi:hypothetical protein